MHFVHFIGTHTKDEEHDIHFYALKCIFLPQRTTNVDLLEIYSGYCLGIHTPAFGSTCLLHRKTYCTA